TPAWPGRRPAGRLARNFLEPGTNSVGMVSVDRPQYRPESGWRADRNRPRPPRSPASPRPAVTPVTAPGREPHARRPLSPPSPRMGRPPRRAIAADSPGGTQGQELGRLEIRHAGAAVQGPFSPWSPPAGARWTSLAGPARGTSRRSAGWLPAGWRWTSRRRPLRPA